MPFEIDPDGPCFDGSHGSWHYTSGSDDKNVQMVIDKTAKCSLKE